MPNQWICPTHYVCSLLLVLASTTLQSQTVSDEIYLPFPTGLDGNPEQAQESVKKTESPSDANSSLQYSTQPSLNSNDKEKFDSSVTEPNKEKVAEQSVTKSKKKKKKSKAGDVDPTEPPLKRGKALLTRNQKQPAEAEFAESYSKEGESTFQARTENANLFGLDAKNTEGLALVEKIDDPDAKIKAQFELARSLDRMGNSESEEKAYKEYLKLVTGFPVHSDITPRTHLAIAVLLIRRQEYRPALHHLVKIFKEFKNAKEFSLAQYYAGRVYEGSWPGRDRERAKKYYDLYLKTTEGGIEIPGNDFRTDATERRRLLETPTGL